LARLSTHVLDTTSGKAAAGVTITLYRMDGESRLHEASTVTNVDGRTDSPLLSGDQIMAGCYELVFGAGDYFRSLGIALPDPPFLDEVVVRFGIADIAGNYHVPLLLSPFGYTTYRGT
jgi:5-hydroxyisourate hydrolase